MWNLCVPHEFFVYICGMIQRKRCPNGKRKTTCSKCGNEKEETRKKQRYCRACHAAHMRATRPKISEMSPEARTKKKARVSAAMALARGQIERQPCEVCGEKAEKHHPDYTKPKEVVWLCRKHHMELHKK